jgi:hypothetical protein
MQTKIIILCLCILFVCDLGYGYKRGEKGKYKGTPEAAKSAAPASEITIEVLVKITTRSFI